MEDIRVQLSEIFEKAIAEWESEASMNIEERSSEFEKDYAMLNEHIQRIRNDFNDILLKIK